MNPKTIRSVTILSAMLVVVGAMIPAPMARFSLGAIAGLLSIVPIYGGGARWRIVGALLATMSLAMSVESYPEAVLENQHYVRRAPDR